MNSANKINLVDTKSTWSLKMQMGDGCCLPGILAGIYCFQAEVNKPGPRDQHTHREHAWNPPAAVSISDSRVTTT